MHANYLYIYTSMQHVGKCTFEGKLICAFFKYYKRTRIVQSTTIYRKYIKRLHRDFVGLSSLGHRVSSRRGS